MAMAIFCLAGIVFDIGYKGNFSLENYRFTKMVVGLRFLSGSFL